MKRLAPLIALLLGLGLPQTGLAQTAALLIGIEDYDRVSDTRRGDEIADAADALDRAGIRVVSRREPAGAALRQALLEFGQMVGSADRVLVALGGRFVSTATETYYLPADGDTGPLAILSETALPLSTVTAWLASRPGQSVLVLATDDLSTAFGPYVSAGLGSFQAPQGVTLVVGASMLMVGLSSAIFIAAWMRLPGGAKRSAPGAWPTPPTRFRPTRIISTPFRMGSSSGWPTGLPRDRPVPTGNSGRLPWRCRSCCIPY